MVKKPICITPPRYAVTKEAAASNPRGSQESDAGARQSASRHPVSSAQKWQKLAALAARLSTLPSAQSFSIGNPPRASSVIFPRGLQAPFPQTPFIRTLGDSRHQSAGFSTTVLREKNSADHGPIEAYDDFGGQWVGDVPDTGNPASFLDQFRNADGGAFDERTLQLYGYTQQIEVGLAELQNASQEQGPYRRKLNALAFLGVDLLKLLCEIPSGQKNFPVFSAVKNSYLTQLDGLFKSSGDRSGRQHFLHQVAQAYTTAGQHNTLDSIPGKLLTHLSESIQREIKDTSNRSDVLSVTGVSMRESLMPILVLYQTMRQRQAGLETLSGNHDQATTHLQKCESIVVCKRILNPDDPSNEHIELYFNLLKSQILAKDREALGTLETLYMVMREFAEHHEDRFDASFPHAVFVRNLEVAYSAFLEETENEDIAVSLDHPIAQLFLNAKEHGLFDESNKLD